MVGVSLAISEVYFLADGELKLWASYLASGAILCYDTALIVSGVILIQAIRKIMKNFQANNQPVQLNIGMVWLHASVYGLFLFATVITTISTLLELLFKSKDLKTFYHVCSLMTEVFNSAS